MVSFRVLLVTSLLWAGSASAEIIWDQPWDGKSGAFIAQEFSDSSNLSAFQLDDFTITRPYYIDKVTVPGFEAGPGGEPAGGEKASEGPRLWVDAAEILDAAVTPAANLSVKNNAVTAEIWEGLPGSFGGHKVMGSSSGGEEAQSGTLVVNFGGQRLPPGQYWLSVYVVRPLHGGGQWFWLSTEKVTGSEHYFYSRGRAYGVGPDPVPASRVPYAEEQVKTDMAFTLQGRPAGEERPSAVPQAPGVLPSTAPQPAKPAPPESAAPAAPAPPPPKAPAAAPQPPAAQAQPSGAGPGATGGPPPPGQPSFPAFVPPSMRMPPMPPLRRPVPPPPVPVPVSPESSPQQAPSSAPGG